MNGLSKITAEILKTAHDKAEEISASADKEILEAKNAADKEISELDAEFEKKLKAEKEHIKLVSESDMRSLRRAELLKVRTEAVSSAVEAVKREIAELDTEKYFSLMKKILEKYARDAKGELKFNKRDSGRVTADFKAFCNKRGITVSPETADIDAGFVIVNGRIVTDCSISELFSDSYSELADAAKAVFEK